MNNNVPKAVALELTYKCNNKCVFCSCPWERDKYIKEKELTTLEWKEIIDKLKDLGVNSITLTGGEALLREDIFELISYIGNIKEIEYKRIITNGAILSEDVLKLLKENDFAISISMPGVKSYIKHTKNYNYESILYWIKKAKEYEISVTTNITVTKWNIDELYENVALPIINGSDTILLNRFLPGGRGLLLKKELELSIDEINKMLEITEEVLESSNKIGNVGTEIPFCIVKNPHKYKKLHIGYICSAGKDFFVIDPSGYIRTCNHSEKKVGKIDNFLNNSYWEIFKNRGYIPEKCIMCDNVSYCDGGCREAANICYNKLDANDTVFDVK